MGTPLAWTTDDPENDLFNGLNEGLGDHAWLIDMDMDCSQADSDGTFQFSTIFSLGGESGEPEVSQDHCDGDLGTVMKFSSQKYHVGKCGAFNSFAYGQGSCKIESLTC